MQHRINLSKALLIAVKNKKLSAKTGVKDEILKSSRIENLQKKYVRYATLSGLTRIRVEEIY